MIPALNMTKIHRSPPGNIPGGGGGGGAVVTMGQSSVSRLYTSRQMSPRTPNVTSPRDTTSSQASAHLTRRAAEVAPVLEMNPLQCQSLGELQRKLIETAEWVMRLRGFYVVQLQERDQWLDRRLRDLEKFYAEAAAAAAAAACVVTTSTTASPSTVGTTVCSVADNGAPATISTAKVGLSGIPHGVVNEAKTTESEQGSNLTPPRRRRSKQQQQQPPTQQPSSKEQSVPSSLVSSPQPSLPNNAQLETASVDVADANSSAGRTRGGAPKKSAVTRIPQGRRTVSANGGGSGGRRPPTRHDGGSSPRLGSTALLSTVDRGEARPTRAARSTAEKDGGTDAHNTTRRRCPPALTASRGSGRVSGFVDGTAGPRLDVLAATVPATTRPGKNALGDTAGSTYLSLSPGTVDRRCSTSSSSRRRSYPSPRAAGTNLAATAPPPPSQYLEAGSGLGRDLNASGAGSAAREHNNNSSSSNNGLNTSVGSLTEPPQGGRTPRDGSSPFYLLGGLGSRPGRVHSTAGSSLGSQRSASRGVSGRDKRNGTSSGNVSSQSSPGRVHAL